jgi:hypothetical protein
MRNAVFYNDTLGSYGLFYDHLDSLNRFGEPAWWAPHVNLGTPTYFFGLLNIPNLGKPAFVSMGLLAWALGRLGIPLPSIVPFYGFYFGILIPFLFLLGVWLVAREILRSRAAIRYTLAVAAFSPAVLLNVSDPGVTENSAYGLMCAATYLRFVAGPSPRRFWILCATALLVSIAVSSPVVLSQYPYRMLLHSRFAAARGPRTVRLARDRQSLPCDGFSSVIATCSCAPGRQQGVGGLSYSSVSSRRESSFSSCSQAPRRPVRLGFLLSGPCGPAQFRVLSAGANGSETTTWCAGCLAVNLWRSPARVRVPRSMLADGAVLTLASAPSWRRSGCVSVLGTINHFGDELYEGWVLLLRSPRVWAETAERGRRSCAG